MVCDGGGAVFVHVFDFNAQSAETEVALAPATSFSALATYCCNRRIFLFCELNFDFFSFRSGPALVAFCQIYTDDSLYITYCLLTTIDGVYHTQGRETTPPSHKK